MHKNINKHRSSKNFLLSLCACALMLTTPLSVAMQVKKNLKEKHYEKIDEFRREYFQTKRLQSKNKDLGIERAKNLSENLMHYNELNWHSNISLHDIIPQKLSDNFLNTSITHFHIIETIHNNDEYSALIISCMRALHEYYSDLPKNNYDMDSAVNPYSSGYPLKPLQKKSCVGKFFLSLLQKQKSNLKNLLIQADKNKNIVYLFTDYSNLFILLQVVLLICMQKLLDNSLKVTIPLSLLGIISILMFFKNLYLRNNFNEKQEALQEKINRINKILSSKYFYEKPTKTSYKEPIPLRAYTLYFEQLYFKAKRFVEENKHTSFIKAYIKAQKDLYSDPNNASYHKRVCLEMLLQQEDYFLFNS